MAKGERRESRTPLSHAPLDPPPYCISATDNEPRTDPKAVELLLALPFTLGYRVNTVVRLLAASLVLEALYAWSWWGLSGDAGAFSQHRRQLHYREHFMTNVATAGGLLLLQKLGAGKYTVDELLKKTD